MKLYTSLVLFPLVIVFAEAMLQNCRMLKCPVNKTRSSSVAYTIKTTKVYYEPKKPVTVIVSAKQCPKKKNKPGPEWYRLEVINSTGAPVIGKFVKPTQVSEDRACEENSLIIFRTCEPLIMHDLPRKHVWRIKKDLGEICFRITFHNKGDNHCEVIKHCIKSKGMILMENATTTNLSNITDNGTLENTTILDTADNGTFENVTIFHNQTDVKVEPSESSGITPVMPTTNEPTKKPTEKRGTDIINILIGNRRRKATNRCRGCRKSSSTADRVCGTDGVTYDSPCHLQREACLTKKKIKIHYDGQCREKPPTYCEQNSWGRIPSSDWYSGCNCFGHFKPRQCYRHSVTKKYECWCSDDFGYKIPGTGKSFTCLEKLTEVMNCF